MADINLGNDTPINTTLNEPSGINTSVSTDTQLNASISDINYIPGYEEAERQRRENEIQRQANELDRIALYEDMEYKKETDYYKGEDGQPGRDGAIQYTAGTGIEITDGNVINNTQTSAEWGNITGTLSDQTDLVNALNNKVDSSSLSNVAFSGSYNDLTNKPTIPTKVSDLTNDSGFITNTVNNLTNYYLKTETYTKNEIDTLIAQIPGFNVVVVQTLPVSDIDTHTIYLVPKTGSTGDIYDEYLYINNAWELIGNTAVDLSNYYTKPETNTLLGNKQDTLVSGTSIKTINNESLLGSGNITVSADDEIAISTTQPTNGEKLWINPDDLPSGNLNPITNQYSVATDKGYSCDYINNLHTYSTDEERVGTWIDGKPIYRKVINVGVVSTSAIDTGITNFKRITQMYGTAKLENIYWIELGVNGAASSSVNCNMNLNADGTKLTFTKSSNSINNCIVIIEYTKTTD